MPLLFVSISSKWKPVTGLQSHQSVFKWDLSVYQRNFPSDFSLVFMSQIITEYVWHFAMHLIRLFPTPGESGTPSLPAPTSRRMRESLTRIPNRYSIISDSIIKPTNQHGQIVDWYRSEYFTLFLLLREKCIINITLSISWHTSIKLCVIVVLRGMPLHCHSSKMN